MSLNDFFDRGGAQGADQLVLQVGGAHVEAERCHIVTGQAGAETGPLESAPEVAFLGGVTQASEPDVEPVRAERSTKRPMLIAPPICTMETP